MSTQTLEITPENVAMVMNEFLEPDNKVTADTAIDKAVAEELFPNGQDDLLAFSAEIHDRFGFVVSVPDLATLSDRVIIESDHVDLDTSDPTEDRPFINMQRITDWLREVAKNRIRST